MNPITHLLLGWELACAAKVSARDRALLTAVSVSPDLDGLGLVIDAGRRLAGASPSAYYATYHHWLFHGLFGAVLSVGIAWWFSSRRLVMLVLAALIFHLHLLCDLVGSRGRSPESIWPIHYLGPFSEDLTFQWSGQWPLNSWPNVLLTCLLLFMSGRRAILQGISPTSLLGHRMDGAFVSTLQKWFPAVRRQG